MRTKVAILLGAVILVWSWTLARAQTSVTIQAPTVAQIVNGTITAGTVTLPACTQMEVRTNISTTGTATGTLQLYIEDSTDNGLTWHDLIASPAFVFGAAVTTQRYQLQANGPGLVRLLSGGTPGAGAEISDTVPAGVRWELLSLRFLLTTSATVANRFVTLTLDDGSTPPFGTFMSVATAQTASAAFAYTFGPALTATLGATSYVAPFPVGIEINPGYRIKTVTTGIQAGDQFSQLLYLVREYRNFGGQPLTQEAPPAGAIRSGPWGDRWRVREKVSSIGGSPVGPTYAITAACKP